MSMTGHVYFFTENRPQNNWDWVRKTLELAGTNEKTSYSMSRSDASFSGWEHFKKSLNTPRKATITSTTDLSELDGFTYLGKRSQIEQGFIEEFDFEKYCLDITPYPCQLLNDCGIIANQIPENIRGDFCINAISFEMGEHDIFEALENPDGTLFGRPFYSFSVFCYNYPNNMFKARNIILQSPFVAELRKKIESFTGDLNVCVFWD
jgi:hypothetical protein